MKILIVTDAWHPQLNGVVRTYEYLESELKAMGHDVKIIGPGDFDKSWPMPGYNEIRLVFRPYKKLAAMIADYAPDLLHIGTEGPLGIAARKYARRHVLRFTSCYHTHFPDYVAKRAAKIFPFLFTPVRNLSIRFIRWFHGPSGCLFVATESLKKTLESWHFKMPIKFMTRGVDFETFHTGPGTLFAALKKPVALYVGRIAIEKNLESFLSMTWAGSKVIVGSGPDQKTLAAKYPDAVFAGVKTGRDLADHYRSADLFVFPSKTDTFGMVLVEAMACGLPLAAYPVTGPVDIISVPALGAVDEDLATAAHRALEHGMPQERSDHARTHYSWRKAAEQFLEI